MLESELSIYYCYRDTRNVKFKEIFELFLEMIADPKRTNTHFKIKKGWPSFE
jgi:hypothetical protein